MTQNVDGLHQKAGTAAELVVEVHGTIWWTRCWECQDRRPMAEALARVRAGEEDPPCEVCGGILKSDTISFGQALVPEVIDRAMQVSEECDLLLAVGSTLSVYPAANCVPRAKAAGARVVIVNGGPTDMDAHRRRRPPRPDRRASCRRSSVRRFEPSTPSAAEIRTSASEPLGRPNPDQGDRLFGMATFRDLLGAAKAEITEVDTAGAAERIDAGAPVLDVREPDEYDQPAPSPAPCTSPAATSSRRSRAG